MSDFEGFKILRMTQTTKNEVIFVRKHSRFRERQICLKHLSQCFYSCVMSFFLLEINGWSQGIKFQQRQQPSTYQLIQTNFQRFKKFDKCIKKHINKHKDFTNTFIKDRPHLATYGISFPNICESFKGLLSLTYKKYQGKVSVLFHFIDKNGQYLKVQGIHMFNQVFRTAFLSSEGSRNSAKLLLNNQNGCVCLELCYFSTLRSNIIQDMDLNPLYKSKNLIVDLYKKFIQPIVPIVQKAYKIKIPIQRKSQQQQPSKLLTNIYRYEQMMTAKVNLNSGTTTNMSSQQTKITQLRQRDQSTIQLFERKMLICQNLKKTLELFVPYQMFFQSKTSKQTHQYHISASEEKQLVSIISIQNPKATQLQITYHQNILNYVRVDQPQRLKTHPLSMGGFAYLQSAQVSFWYMDSFCSNKQGQLTQRNVQKKYMALKRDSRPQNSKNLHEYNILAEIRNGFSTYFPKYYLPINFPGYNINQNPLLMMQLLPDGNLGELLRMRKKTLSLLSKMYLLLSITMGLRYLETYNVVHLDVKPNNIMIAPGLNVKIIDFGQAYHHEVCRKQGKGYKPGFTTPYSPPQYPLGVRQGFTNKADVYSLGVLMFEVIYGKVPFEKREKMFLASENCDLYGDPVIIRILNWLISRCICRNPDQRPELDWVAIILRLSLELVT